MALYPIDARVGLKCPLSNILSLMLRIGVVLPSDPKYRIADL